MSLAVEVSDQIRKALVERGAAAVGVAEAAPLPDMEVCIKNSGYAGNLADMTWLFNTASDRTNPSRHLNNAKSVICSMWPYSRNTKNRHFAKYSQHRDYHDFIHGQLQKAWEFCGFGKKRAIFFVDSRPLAEKAYAALSGLGWIGKNSLLINPYFGSFFCLGTILTDLELSPDTPMKDGCGDCSKCIDACPTGAIISPALLDCRKCISYLTTEYKDEIPCDLQKKIGDSVFGCDICQNVCPYNQDAEVLGVIPSAFDEALSLDQMEGMDEGEFKKSFDGTPIMRLGRKRFLRNVNVALKNAGGVKSEK